MSYGGGDFIQFNFQYYNNFLKKITDDRNNENTPYPALKNKLSCPSKNMVHLQRAKRHSVTGNVTVTSKGSHHNNKECNDKNRLMSNNTITEYVNENNAKGKDKGSGNDVVKYVVVENDAVKDMPVESWSLLTFISTLLASE